jgi:ABC-type lipoprotein release transport system permease subunit
MAIGASAADVVGLLVRDSLRPIATGFAVGLVAVLLGVRVFTAVLFGISPYDPAAIGGAVVILLGSALTAVIVPARRAGRTDPVSVLRES